ncbi:DUF4236 domain-containing protein [Frankia sp. Mgl5]|uniref:DUF4236 domain-containing protein n=1 Tax=Parafrankia soli TaxID=2599596 RepID=A0A1S1PEC3_9ACTN|nr:MULTISPECIES: DUF4236 domain-containing protein [Frankiaceae]ABW16236.1 conserved hypothetical protein [Frankia sp. EAN1pec]CAI7974071.1 DUF4236 domain-containing protein [Frankia sp. Hr75.2]MCK9929199.1 DUF4236 domain-containing protein [Frankia sp. Mgl5]OHV19621.1 hypothetical protein BBK14_08930 [Parafrankia soli]TCJ32904.1 DUF4236 domain-containing protein [Parafrankia sp. BMG5.11]
MGLRYTRRPRYGPFHVNVSENGVSSVTLKLGRVSWRVWSKNRRGGLSSVDLPGPFSYRRDGRRRASAGR